MDPPAAPSSLHPMVNDLNLKLQGSDNKTIFPNGMNKKDSINNVEVIHGKSAIMFKAIVLVENDGGLETRSICIFTI